MPTFPQADDFLRGGVPASAGLESPAVRASIRGMPMFVANADYEEKDRNPIDLRAGQEVTAGPVDRAWPGWVWATDGNGRSGYVPEEILEPLGEGRFSAMEDFDPTVLVVRRGDVLDSRRQIHGWHWCRHADGREGWVAGYLLRPA